MTNYEFKIFCFKVWQRANKKMPRDTGNLADNSFKSNVNGDECEMYIDLDIAPYGVYLEDGTPTSSKHVGFWERCISEAVKEIAIEYYAKVEES